MPAGRLEKTVLIGSAIGLLVSGALVKDAVDNIDSSPPYYEEITSLNEQIAPLNLSLSSYHTGEQIGSLDYPEMTSLHSRYSGDLRQRNSLQARIDTLKTNPEGQRVLEINEKYARRGTLGALVVVASLYVGFLGLGDRAERRRNERE